MKPGDTVDRYRLDTELARGPAGAAYVAFDAELDREVVVKVLPPGAPVDRLKREAQALARLTHPGVVRVYDVGEHEGHAFVAMERVRGATLRAWLSTPRSVEDTLAALRRAGEGLAATHRAALVHGAVAMDAVLVADDGRVLVDDFAFTGDATPATDQRAFRAMAWEAIHGKPAFEESLRAGVPAHVERALRDGAPSMDALLAALAARPTRRWVAPAALGVLAGAGALAVVVVGSSRVDDPAQVCRLAAAAIDRDWTPDTAAQVTARVDGASTAALAFYVDRWRERRAAACLDGNLAQGACLDRARVSFRQAVAGVVAASTTLQPDAIVRVLPALERCDAPTAQAAPPPPDVVAKVAALDARLAVLEVGALTRVPMATREQVAALRAEASALGYRPQILRVQLLEGLVAALARDDAAATAIYREVMVAAEADADDYTRARAGAQLANLLVRQRSPDAPAAITSARAALARAGRDTSIEILLLGAEAAYAFGRDEFRAAAEAHERIIALALAQYGPEASLLGEEYAAAAGAFALAGEHDRAAVRYRDMTDALERDLRRRGLSAPEAAAMAADPTIAMTAGDFAASREAGLRRLGALRRAPRQNLVLIADTLSSLGRANEFDGRFEEAIGYYEEAVATYRRPLAELAQNNDAPDPDVAVNGVVDNLIGLGTCLYNLGQYERAAAVFGESVEAAEQGGMATAGSLPSTRRWLGQARTMTGEHRAAIALLEPIVAAFPTTPTKPYSRGLARFSLARSLWVTGGARDLDRADALASDAEADFREALKDAVDPRQPYLKLLTPLATKQLDALATWRTTRTRPRR